MDRNAKDVIFQSLIVLMLFLHTYCSLYLSTSTVSVIFSFCFSYVHRIINQIVSGLFFCRKNIF